MTFCKNCGHKVEYIKELMLWTHYNKNTGTQICKICKCSRPRGVIKAIIVTAGKGTRMYPLTLKTPKILLPMGDETIIYHTLRVLENCGIDDVVMVVGHQADQIEDYVGERARFVYDPFRTNILESLWVAREELNGEFVLLYGDVLFHEKILVDLLKTKEDIVAVVSETEVDDESEKCVIENGLLKRISKQIPEKKANAEYIGITKFSSTGARLLREIIDKTVREDNFAEHYYTVALERLIQAGHKVNVFYTGNLPWIEMDFPNEYEAAQNIFPLVCETET